MDFQKQQGTKWISAKRSRGYMHMALFIYLIESCAKYWKPIIEPTPPIWGSSPIGDKIKFDRSRVSFIVGARERESDRSEMTILYSLVARGTVVLAEFNASATNAGAIAKQILEKIPSGSNDSHLSYSQDRYVFHVKRTDGLTVLCMADESSGRRIPFAFLEDIHGRFVKAYGRACHTALAYAMNDEFSRILSQQMEYYSSDPNADRINRIRGEMNQVRNVMIENIDKVLDRGDRLELLVDKTSHMQGNTLRFRKQARRFRNTVWWRNVKLMIMLIVLLLIIIYIVLAFVCHGITLPSCLR
ncbi:Vesicle-associated membrane protein 711 [Acorus gramineus]|uniref:Vesicle-associated membrane protein 711 n=1 Tax=Acorus gramineus TaxID=55184 RepID=A0AAV9BJN1_ACOGR|nr:Vesicle-associated membrane protein 711 [Acorus gramineus]